MLTHLPFSDDQTITVIGDQVGPDDQGFGSDWVRHLEAVVIAHAPERRVRVIDRTGPGERVHLMRQRWCDDVLWDRPDWVIVHPGLSDIWHDIRSEAEAMDADTLAATLEQLIAFTRERLPEVRFVIVDPVHGSTEDDPYWNQGQVNARLQPVRAALADLCARCSSCVHASPQPALDGVLDAQGAGSFAGEDAQLGGIAPVLIVQAILEALAVPVPPAPAVQAGERIVFIGDSITDAGRRRPATATWGGGYLHLWRAWLHARHPDLAARVDIVNRGIAGQVAQNLVHRWQRDCLDHKPDHVVVAIGINDCNRWLASSAEPVSPDGYRACLEEMVRHLQAARPACRLWGIAPFFISRDDHPASYRARVMHTLPDYIAIMHEVVEGAGGHVLDTHAVFQLHLDHRPPRAFGTRNGFDIVHPNLTGQMIMAEGMASLMAERADRP